MQKADKLAIYYCILILTAFLFLNQAEAATNVCGTVSGTWAKNKSPFNVTCPVTVSGSLTIQAGATVKFASATHMIVSGTLTALGTSTSPIVFTSSASNPTRGSWRGIYFEAGSANSQLSYINITWGGNTGYSSNYDASLVINVDPGPTLMDHITISESSTNGLKVLNNWSSRSLTNSTISNCTTKGATIQNGIWDFNNSTFSSNGSYGAYIDYYGVSSFTNVTFTNNTDYAIGAIGSARIFSTTGISATGNGGGTKNALGYLGGYATFAGTTWTSGFNRVVLAPSFVNTTGTLVIQAGANIKFASGAYLQTQNTLTAVGTASQPITFTSSAASPTRGSWGGIYFETGSASSQLSYVNISWAGGSSNVGAIVINSATSGPTIDHTTVTESSTSGIKFIQGWPTNISDTSATNCTGDGIRLTDGGLNLTNPTLSNNGGYGIYVDRYAYLNLTGGTISNNVDYALGTIGDGRINVNTAPVLNGNGSGTKNGIAHLGGFIDGIGSGATVTWDSEIPIFVIENVTVTTPGVLAINAGATIKFAATKWLEIDGRLTALGTVQSPILFTSSASTPTPGSWGGVGFESTSTGSQVKYATISYAGYAKSSQWDGAIVVNGSSPILDYLTLNFSSAYGIRFPITAGAAPTISHCTFASNTAGGLRNDSPANIDAKLNYWNSSNGPGGAGPGSGQSISTNVLFDPFYSAAPTNPQLITTVSVINQTFNPANGINLSVPFASTLSGNWTALFKNSIGTILRTYTGTGQSPTVVWDGRDAASTLMLDGTYNFELQSTALTGEVSAPVKSVSIIIDSTKTLAISSFTASPNYFSPNGDGVQETTTAQGTFNFGDVNWTLNFRDAGNNIVRTTTGQGGSFSYAWDGKDSGAVVQADGGYSVELLINDGNMNGSSTKSVTIDKTFPVSQISYPNGGGVLSNVYQAGSMNVTVTGNNSDLNFLNWSLDYGSGASPSSWTALGNGTLPVSGSIVTWNTSALTNGTYTLRLQTWDLAGNRSPSLATLTVGNFKVSQSYQEMPFGGTQSYTSNVPFPLTETIVIKDSAGNIVRNLVSGVSRNAGTYIDAWNGRTNSNAYLPDGGYLYEATVTDGTNSLNWNLTKAFFPTYESYDTFPNWNPFNNNPLVITMPYNYSPAQYVWVFAPPGNFWQGPDATVYGLIYGGCQPPNFCPVDHKYIESGTMVFDWAGVDAIGAFRSDIKAYALAWDELSPNAVVIYGTRPKFTQRASISPALFYPVKGPQTVSYTFTSYQNQPVNVTATFLNQSSLSTLRTMNLANVTPGAKTISWDGKADNGMWVAPGYYTITVKITDSIGNVATSQILTTVRY